MFMFITITERRLLSIVIGTAAYIKIYPYFSDQPQYIEPTLSLGLYTYVKIIHNAIHFHRLLQSALSRITEIVWVSKDESCTVPVQCMLL